MATDLETRHKMIALPCVRVRTPDAGGSGTVLYSREGDEGFSTYVLTNHHVVETCIKIVERWSTLLKSTRKMDEFETVDVHIFSYKWESRAIGASVIQSDIMAYDPDEDLALLKLQGIGEAPAVAEMYPRNAEAGLRIGMPTVCVGAGLGEPPVQTGGFLSVFGRTIERKEYWLNTAPGIYGNSGGALFLADTLQFIGVPARIAVTGGFFGSDAVTHLMYAIPITRVYNFLEAQRYRFIYDDAFTEEGEKEERASLREAEERKMAMASGSVHSPQAGAGAGISMPDPLSEWALPS